MFDNDDGVHWHGAAPPSHLPAKDWGRNPHQHTLDQERLGCAEGCPACLWNRARNLRSREDLNYPPIAYVPNELDMKMLAAMKIDWFGDNRG